MPSHPTGPRPHRPRLEEDQTYTITVTRKDPKGEGDGFTNTRHRYVGKVTFVATRE